MIGSLSLILSKVLSVKRGGGFQELLYASVFATSMGDNLEAKMPLGKNGSFSFGTISKLQKWPVCSEGAIPLLQGQ